MQMQSPYDTLENNVWCSMWDGFRNLKERLGKNLLFSLLVQ